MTDQTTIAASTATTSLPNGRIVTARLAGALFLSAFLLFVLEPMVAKRILPTFGGTPMEWNTRLRGTEVRIEFVTDGEAHRLQVRHVTRRSERARVTDR